MIFGMESSVLEDKAHSEDKITADGNSEGNDNLPLTNVDFKPPENKDSVSEEDAEKVTSATDSKEVKGKNVIEADQQEPSIAPIDAQQEISSQNDILETSPVTDANVDALDKIPSVVVDKTPSGTIDKIPSGTIDKIPSGTIDKIPSGTIDKIPSGTIEKIPRGTDVKISEDDPSKDIANQDVSETYETRSVDANLKTEDTALLRIESEKSLRSLQISSKESLTVQPDKEPREEIKTVASYEDLKQLSITSGGSEKSQISIIEETSEIAAPQKESSFPRTEIIEKCRNLLVEIRQLRLKNILIQKKLHDYFKRKKAEGTYREGESVLGSLAGAQAEIHYRKHLLMFEDVLDNDAAERAKIDSESKELFHTKTELLDDAETQINLLLEQEETFGHGLIYSNSGKILPDKSREIRTKAKKYLNNLRSEIYRLQREAGLLIHHSLLRDFENVLMKISEVEQEVNIMKKNSSEDRNKRMSVQNFNRYAMQKWNYEGGMSSFSQENGSSYPEKILDKNPTDEKGKARQTSNPDARSGHIYSRILKGRPSILKFFPQ